MNLATSSWGIREGMLDVRALRRYKAVLSNLLNLGEILIFALLGGVFIGIIWLLTLTNFENVIFYDGTDMTCVFNGKTEKILNVE